MSTEPAALGPAELHQQIGQGLVAAAPPGWVELRMTQVQVGKAGQTLHRAVLTSGEEHGRWSTAMDVGEAMYELRRLTYQPGKGAWYTAVVTVTSSGSISFDFDYDGEPEWDIEVVPESYVEDLEMFPRDEEHRPAWLREKLELAGR